jgi:hypothetical protein
MHGIRGGSCLIQATGKSTFEDGLRFGGSGSDLKWSQNVCTRLPVGYCLMSKLVTIFKSAWGALDQYLWLWVRSWSVHQECFSGIFFICLAEWIFPRESWMLQPATDCARTYSLFRCLYKKSHCVVRNGHVIVCGRA